MSLMKMKPRGSFGRASMAEAWQFRLILAVSFALMLAYAVVSRLLAYGRLREERSSSIFSEARSAAYAAAGYALQH